ncbi:hypothetical protein [Streptomyces ipomoeae]|uniref:hypothetical protein n=1 Tax=Streptomyces ipomoeae TaxID=103232 RepID=UPI0015F03031|nr:hypothetical protein [Streptomyces ipomoeae]
MAQPQPELELCEHCEALVVRPWERVEGIAHVELGDGPAPVLGLYVLTDAEPCTHPRG